MNETIKTILARRSIKAYKPDMPEDRDIKTILECGQFAPTGRGSQPWYFLVLQNREFMTRISEANREILLKSPDEYLRKSAEDPEYDSWRGAPMAILVFADNEKLPIAAADCANAVENMALAAWSLGLGSCYLGSFKLAMSNPEYSWIISELGVPEGLTPMYALTLGYIKGEPAPRPPRREGRIKYVK